MRKFSCVHLFFGDQAQAPSGERDMLQQRDKLIEVVFEILSALNIIPLQV